MKLNSPTLSGNVLVLPILSSRNKDTGKYQLSTDGNVNSMLHLIAINYGSIDSVEFVLPRLELIDEASLEDFKNILSTYEKFKDIKFVLHTDDSCVRNSYHQKSTLETRKYVNDTISQLGSSYHFSSSMYSLKHIDTVISEFPFKFNFKDDFEANTTIIYNINWSLTDDSLDLTLEHNNELARSYKFELEQILNTKADFEFAVYSDIQYNYFKEKVESYYDLMKIKNDFDNLNFYRKHEIYDADFIKWVADREIAKLSEEEKEFVLNLLGSDSETNVFLMFRLNDERYDLLKLIDHYNKTLEKAKFILTNPTKTSLSKEAALRLHYLPNENQWMDISRIELSHQRGVYFYLLKSATKNDKIPHFEPDMHMAMIEQFILCDSSIDYMHKNLTPEIVEQYLKK